MFVKDSKDMGVQLNTSFVGNDKDGYTAGAHIVTSDGLDISNETKGDSLESVIQKLMTNLIKEALLSNIEDKKEESKEDSKAKKMRELEDKLHSVSDEMDKVHADMLELEERYNDLNYEYDTIEDELYALENDDEDEQEEGSTITLDDVLNFDGDFLDYLRDNFNIS